MYYGHSTCTMTIMDHVWRHTVSCLEKFSTRGLGCEAPQVCREVWGGRQAPQLPEICLHNLTFLVQIFGTIAYKKASIDLSRKSFVTVASPWFFFLRPALCSLKHPFLFLWGRLILGWTWHMSWLLCKGENRYVWISLFNSLYVSFSIMCYIYINTYVYTSVMK